MDFPFGSYKVSPVIHMGDHKIPKSLGRFIISSHQMVSPLFLVALCDESHLALLNKMYKHSLIRGKPTQDDDDDVSLIPMTYGNHID